MRHLKPSLLFGNASISTTQSKFDSTSLYLDGTGDYITVPNSSNFDMAASDFTIEMWVYPTSFSDYQTLYINRDVSDGSSYVPIHLALMANGKVALWTSATGSSWTIDNLQTSVSLSTNTWAHIALVRNGSNWVIYIDGTSRASTTDSSSLIIPNYAVVIGSNSSGSYAGYIDEYRVTKGYARYTSGFTPDSTTFWYKDPFWSNVSLLLHCNGANNGTTFYDDVNHAMTANGNAVTSTAQSKFGGSSFLSDGTGDYLSTPTSTSFDIMGGDFTIEAFVRIANNSAVDNGGERNATIVACYPTVSPSNCWGLFIQGDGTNTGTGIRFVVFHSNTLKKYEVTSTLNKNQWYHIAVSRNSSGIIIFIDGVKQSSTTDTITTDTGTMGSHQLTVGSILIGGYNNCINGYIDELRITKGVCRYYNNFTVPTEEFYSFDPFYSGVQALFHFNNTVTNSSGIDDDCGNSYLTTVGTTPPVISSTQSKFGGKSLSCSGAGAIVINRANLNFGTSPLTVEFWVYPSSSGGVFNNQASSNRFNFYLDSSVSARLILYNANVVTGITLAANTWQHVAIVRVANTWTVYVNGTFAGSGVDSNSYDITSGTGIGGSGSGIHYFTGYVDELRITKGYARYLANFTAPSMPFEATKTPYPAQILVPTRVKTSAAETVMSISNLVYYSKEPLISLPNYYDGGTYSISGKVTYNYQPAYRKVSLLTAKDKRLIQETWSDPITGVYTFTQLLNQEYIIWCEDYTRVLSAVSHLSTDQTNIAFTDQVAFDPDDYVGSGSLHGTILDSNSNPLSRRVALIDPLTYIKISTTVSDPITGAYSFTGLNTSRTYNIVFEDNYNNPQYNDIIRARCTPV